MNKIAEKLQAEFKCEQCGMCCCLGSGITIDEEEVEALAALYSMDKEEFKRECLIAAPDGTGKFSPVIDRPCGFLEFGSRKCTVHEAKPRICRDYPWLTLKRGECDVSAVMICKVARKQLEKLVRGE